MSTIAAGLTSTNALVSTGDTSGQLVFQTNGTTTAMTIDTSQNVGIGTTSPAAKLHVSSGNSTNLAVNGSTKGVRFDFDSTQTSIVGVDNTFFGSYQPLFIGGSYLAFGNGITEKMRLDSSGTVRVNNTSTPTGYTGFGGEYFVGGSGGNTALFYTTGGLNSGVPIQSARANDGAGIYFFRNGSAAGYIQITTGAISLNNSSDYRLKYNVENLTGSLSKILQVRPVTFNWKENDAVGKSVIAHELQEIFPDAVIGEKDAINEDGSIKPQSVALGNLIPDLIVAIQEQQTIINELKSRIETLENK